MPFGESRIRMLMRIRIRVLRTKNLKKFTAEKIQYFFDHKLQITFPKASIKDVQAREVFSQGVTKRCRQSLLTKSALVYESTCGGIGGLRGLSQMRTAVRVHIT
jgi:hypothetical protein